MNMRRKDREVTDDVRIEEIIQSCECCRIGLADGDEIYMVPMNFAYENTAENKFFYFHSAREGRKLDLIRRTGKAGFELDTNHGLNTSDKACGHSYRFLSVIGHGDISLVTDGAEKEKGLQLIMKHYTGRDDWDFEEKHLNAVEIIKLTVRDISCKEHK